MTGDKSWNRGTPIAKAWAWQACGEGKWYATRGGIRLEVSIATIMNDTVAWGSVEIGKEEFMCGAYDTVAEAKADCEKCARKLAMELLGVEEGGDNAQG